MEQRDDDHVVGSKSGLDSVDARDCLSTDEVLAHLDQRLEGTRLQSVRDHLDACSGCRVVMAEAARVATRSSQASRVPRTLADGEKIAGRYEVRRFIARGGMGEVYEASDAALGETIALKTLIVTAVDQADAVKRLLAEVRIARKVTHPNVCRILEFGTHQRAGSTDEPIPFLTMPLLRGETLAKRIERVGRLPPVEAQRILSDLAGGLAAVHAVGVVHRDFKSDNAFLVRNDDGSERAVVMDFGLARALETPGDANRSTGRILLGTPAYMAPEQVEGKTITKAVDVYALGVVAFELTTGRVPFVAESAAAVALARLQQRVVAPSSLAPGLDKRWDDVIQRCLKRAPDERFRTMTELTAALDRIGSGTRPRSWGRVAALAAGAAIVAMTIWVATRSSGANSSARALGVASDNAARTRGAAPPAPLSPTAAPRADASPLAPPKAHASERPRPPARRQAAPPRSPAPAAPGTSPPAVTDPAAAAVPSEPPPASRPRQADDLVDPF